MPVFSYIATNEAGKSTRATIEAESLAIATEQLKKQHLHVLSIHKAGGAGKLKLPFGNKVKMKELVIFTRQLATMVNAGVPLTRALTTLQAQAEDKVLKQQLSGVLKSVESGASLGDALSQYKDTFSTIYINMVRAGEEGGILDQVLNRLALQLEKDAAIRGKIKSAMTYPAVISVIMVVAFFILMTTIVPKIGSIVKNVGGPDAKLPIYTVIMLKISDIMLSPIFLVAAFILLPIAVYFFRKFIKTKHGRLAWHGFLLKLPIVKTLIVKTAIARFARTFSSLMGAGVSIIQAINTTAGAVGNAVIEKELLDSAKAIKSGQQLSSQLEKSKHFPPIVSQMLAVGEETGQTDQILVKVAEFYEEEVDVFVGSLSSIIEPLMIVVLGGVVGLIAASVMGPLASLSQNIK